MLLINVLAAQVLLMRLIGACRDRRDHQWCPIVDVDRARWPKKRFVLADTLRFFEELAQASNRQSQACVFRRCDAWQSVAPGLSRIWTMPCG